MTSNDVLSMYETLAGLTGRMAGAAHGGDLESLARLETQCVIQAAATATGVPLLDGAPRLRKIDLLKQIMANDRAIRAATESQWALEDVMAAH